MWCMGAREFLGTSLAARLSLPTSGGVSGGSENSFNPSRTCHRCRGGVRLRGSTIASSRSRPTYPVMRAVTPRSRGSGALRLISRVMAITCELPSCNSCVSRLLTLLRPSEPSFPLLMTSATALGWCRILKSGPPLASRMTSSRVFRAREAWGCVVAIKSA